MDGKIPVTAKLRTVAQPLIETKGLGKTFTLKKDWLGRPQKSLQAVRDVSLTVGEGEILGVVGESGCGKSTLGRLILRLIDASEGEVFYRGQDISKISQAQMRPLRQKLQIVFQDPYSSLNPRFTIYQTLSEPIQIHKLLPAKDIRPRVAELLNLVGLPEDAMDRYPHAFSGGQRQRIAIARAMALGPEFIVADEPVSSLDVSIQAQVLNLFKDLKEQFNLAYLFISHNLSVVAHLCDRVCVMYMGQVVEEAPAQELLGRPLHPYTQTLMAAVPVIEEEERPDLPAHATKGEGEVTGEVPTQGCLFAPRCPLADDACRRETVDLTLRQGRMVRCLKV